jgi:hypothetical protein
MASGFAGARHKANPQSNEISAGVRPSAALCDRATAPRFSDRSRRPGTFHGTYPPASSRCSAELGTAPHRPRAGTRRSSKCHCTRSAGLPNIVTTISIGQGIEPVAPHSGPSLRRCHLGNFPAARLPASPWGRLFRLVPECRFCVKQSLMPISVKYKKRGRGRPATGHSPIVGVRMPPEERRAVEAWAAKQEDRPSLSKAIRHLVALALAAEMKRRR